MDKKYVVLITNTFDERYSNVYGLYTLEEAMKLLHKCHTNILNEWEDELYDNATMEDAFIEDGYFTINWGDNTYSDCTVAKIKDI